MYCVSDVVNQNQMWDHATTHLLLQGVKQAGPKWIFGAMSGLSEYYKLESADSGAFRIWNRVGHPASVAVNGHYCVIEWSQ